MSIVHNLWKQKTKILKNIAILFATLVLISILTFMIVKLQPGDPAINYLKSMQIGISTETIEYARNLLNLDKSLVEQYFIWLSKALHGDFGISYIEDRAVLSVIKDAALPTLKLGGFSFVILLILSLFIGIISALYQGSFMDSVLQFISYVFVSVPTFWLGYLLIIYFSVRLKILPVSGMSGISSYILPGITLMVPLAGQTGLFIRKNIMMIMSQSHVENAIARGVKKRYVITNHLLRNAIIPIITIFSYNISYLITGSVLIEEIFAWPGLGRMFVNAVRNGDLPLIQGSLLLFGIMAILINNLTQEIVYFIDPNIRVKKRRAYHEEK